MLIEVATLNALPAVHHIMTGIVKNAATPILIKDGWERITKNINLTIF